MLGLAILFSIAFALIVIIGSAVIIHGLQHPPRKTFGVALARGLPTSPGEIGLDFLELPLRFDDGTTTTGWIARCDDKGPDKPIVVISHGWGDSRYGALTWITLIQPFAAYVATYDLRGHGDATATRCAMGTVEADDVLAVIRQVRDTLGEPTRKVVLFGYSLGGGVSIVAAAKEPAAVAGVIGDGVYRDMMEPVRGVLRIKGAPTWCFLPVVRLLAPLRMPSAQAFDRAGHAARMPQPLLLLHGTADSISPYDSGVAIAEAAPQGELVTFEGSDHLALARDDEARYREALDRFFAKIASQPSLAAPQPAPHHPTQRASQPKPTHPQESSHEQRRESH